MSPQALAAELAEYTPPDPNDTVRAAYFRGFADRLARLSPTADRLGVALARALWRADVARGKCGFGGGLPAALAGCHELEAIGLDILLEDWIEATEERASYLGATS